MKDFYTITEAATWLTTVNKEIIPKSEKDIVIDVKRSNLPVYIEFDGELTCVSITHPDGVIEIIELPVIVKGIVKSLDPPPCDESKESAWTVEVVYACSQNYGHKGGGYKGKEVIDAVRVKGHKLPTIEETQGYMRPGYTVKGLTGYMKVPKSDWLFHIQDLEAIAGVDISKINSESTPPSCNGESTSSVPPKDILSERGCRRLIRENWEEIKKAFGKNADGTQILHILNRHKDSIDVMPKLKTVQNKLIELRNEGLLP